MNEYKDHRNLDNLEDETNVFESLMPFRVKNILLVASLYDSFLLADDERLNEALFGEDHSTSFKIAPRITRVSTSEKAYQKIQSGNIDMVIAMVQMFGTNMKTFIYNLKSISPDLPVVLLSFNTHDIINMADEVKDAVDGIFLWHGDTRLFPAIINLIEDVMNFEEDSKVGVQAVLLVEDNIKFYSSYLPVIYGELMKQTQIVMSDELNLQRKLLRLKARPKILLAENYEKAWSIYSRYTSNLLGVISDIEFPVGKTCDPNAGIKLADAVKARHPDMPVMLQSFKKSTAMKAREMDVTFVFKGAPDLTRKLRNFIVQYFGFGDFAFTDESGQDYGKASDLHSMLAQLKTVPITSILYHAMRNHFSKWLLARTEFEIAYYLRPRKISEYSHPEQLRELLVETLFQFIYKSQMGTVLKFDINRFNRSTPLVKIGSGSLGGKARGLAFTHFLLGKKALDLDYKGIEVTSPETIVLATDIYDFFMEQNGLDSMDVSHISTAGIANLFTRARLPTYVMKALRTIVKNIEGPIAVRSSSLLEDSKTQPFAGIYNTYMLSNNHENPEYRLRELEKAIKFVYASTLCEEARSYRKMTPHLPDEEKMAVVIQKVVGRTWKSNHFYPVFSGVLQSYNHYPVPPLKNTDCIAFLAFGLGKSIVEGHTVLRFSPNRPKAIHQFANLVDYLSNSQKVFAAIDMKRSPVPLTYETEPDMVMLDTESVVKDGPLALAASTYSQANEMMVDTIYGEGPKIITFAPLLKNKMFPVANLLKDLAELGRKAMGCHVEMEFAADYDPENHKLIFNIIQMRPMVSRFGENELEANAPVKGKFLVSSESALGNGNFENISSLIIVKPEAFDTQIMPLIADEIGQLNRILMSEEQKYILIGPGRWGSQDPFLGIPVKWNQISNARIIVEADYSGFSVDPSYGTHFFHNVTSLGIGYITVNTLREKGRIDWQILQNLPVIHETDHVRAVSIDRPLKAYIDGNDGYGFIAIPDESE